MEDNDLSMPTPLQALLRRVNSRIQVDFTVTAARHLSPSTEEALADPSTTQETQLCSEDARERMSPTFRGCVGHTALDVWLWHH